MTLKIFIGWDEREQEAYDVCVKSLLKHSSVQLDIQPIIKSVLMDTGEYFREQPEAGSEEFTYTRFLTPYLAGYRDWALFVDCDFLFTKDVAELFAMKDEQYALMCVKHDYVPKNAVKMDGQKQVSYPRKNWSSCILWNCGHLSNRILTPYIASRQTGAYLHRFQGEYDKPEVPPAAIHFTNGGPWFENWQNVDYADLWKSYLK